MAGWGGHNGSSWEYSKGNRTEYKLVKTKIMRLFTKSDLRNQQ